VLKLEMLAGEGKDPVVKSGDLVRVQVLEVDLERKRIALSRRLDEPAERARPGRSEMAERGARQPQAPNTPSDRVRGGGKGPSRPSNAPASGRGGALADAFAKARKG